MNISIDGCNFYFKIIKHLQLILKTLYKVRRCYQLTGLYMPKCTYGKCQWYEVMMWYQIPNVWPRISGRDCLLGVNGVVFEYATIVINLIVSQKSLRYVLNSSSLADKSLNVFLYNN